MVILSEFIKEEINDHIKSIILTTINEGKYYNRTKDELIFNRYSVEFLFTEKQVIICDDIFSEDKPLYLELDDFFSIILNLETK